MADQEAKKGGHPNKGSLQAYIQDFTKEAIDGIVEIMRTSRNEGLKFAAQKLIIDKSIADIKAVEHSGTDGGDILVRIIKDDRLEDSELPEATGDIQP